MVKRFFNLLHREVRGLHEAAYLLGFFAVFSQILALVRDRLLTGKFGAGEILDIYYAAFRIPDFIFVSIASIVSLSVLIPFLTERVNSSEDKGRQFIGNIFVFFSFSILSVSIAAFILTPELLKVFVPGLAQAALYDELVVLTRLLLLQPIFLGLSSLFASVVHVYQRFVVYAISPLLYNVGIILGVLFFYPAVGIIGLGYGVVLGAFFHMLLQLSFIVKKGFLPRFPFRFNISEIKQVVILSFPRTLALSSSQISFIFLIALASFMAEGSIAVFSLSFNLQSVPLAIIGVSYSVAAFPTLARLYSNGQRDTFFTHMTMAARHIIFWSLPSIVLFIVLRAQIVRVILGSGEFTWADTRLTAAALALFSVSILAQSLVLLFVRGYYAAGKTVKPLMVNVFSSLLMVIFSFAFIALFKNAPIFQYFVESLLRVEGIDGTSVLMLPLAYSLAFLINAFLFWYLFQKDFKKFSSTLSRTFFESLSAAAVMGIATHQFLNVFDNVFDLDTFLGIFAQGLLSGILGIIVGILTLKLLGNKEIDEVWRSLHNKFWKTKVISSE
ncbi:hypothetical protein IIC45_00620 [Patescibacteria group bacterium]|nr:hypothetical protein [Patescibacteria group bacterium]